MEEPRKEALEKIIDITTSSGPLTKLESTAKLIGYFCSGAAGITLATHFLPSAVRNINEPRINQPVLNDREVIALELGTWSGIAIGLGAIWLYSEFTRTDDTELLLIPMATNLISAFYEAGRTIYTRNKQAAPNKYKTITLENDVL